MRFVSTSLSSCKNKRENVIYTDDVVKANQALEAKLDGSIGSAPFVDGDALWGLL